MNGNTKSAVLELMKALTSIIQTWRINNLDKRLTALEQGHLLENAEEYHTGRTDSAGDF